MCIISNVMDELNRTVPWINPVVPTDPVVPFVIPQGVDYTELRELIDKFKAAVEGAKKVDAFMGNPDCIDPEKALLQQRVERLEKVIDALLAERAK